MNPDKIILLYITFPHCKIIQFSPSMCSPCRIILISYVILLFSEAFKIFDRNRDGFIDMNELKKVTSAFPPSSFVLQVSMMLGSEVDPAEIDELMEEADVVRSECYQ